MRWVSIAELQSELDPAKKRAMQNRHLEECVAQAKMEQEERHHLERQRIEREKLETSIEVATIQGRNARELELLKAYNEQSLAMLSHTLGAADKSSSLIDEMARSTMRQEEEWHKAFTAAMSGLVLSEADTIKQERLRKLDQEHLIEKLRLESSLRMIELVLGNEVQNLRLTYDRTCEIIFRLVERALDLGAADAGPDAIREWVKEAMEQTGEQ
jgi:hypothetical protein